MNLIAHCRQENAKQDLPTEDSKNQETTKHSNANDYWLRVSTDERTHLSDKAGVSVVLDVMLNHRFANQRPSRQPVRVFQPMYEARNKIGDQNANENGLKQTHSDLPVCGKRAQVSH